MLNALFNPKAIAVIGASRDPRKVGSSILENLIKFNFQGKLYPINPSSPDVQGLKAFHKVSYAGGDTDLAVIAIPAPFVPDALRDCAAAGVRAAVIVSAGFKEAGPEGLKLEEEIKAIGREHNIRIVGPNCIGVINTINNMNATFAPGMLPPGRIAFFSQSGALGMAILDWAIGNRLGFSKFISLGNKADLSEIDFIEYFIEDPDTDIILGYIEDVVDGRRFMEVAQRATKKKPIILLKSGGTEAGARAASSHTGALAGSETAFRAAFSQTGIIRAEGVRDLFDAAITFSGGRLPAGERLLVITNAGGPGILAADTAERLGLKMHPLSAESINAMAPLLPGNASLYNPVDIIGDATSERYAVVIDRAMNDPQVDGMLVILTPQAMTDVENTAGIVMDAATKTDKPIITSFMGDLRVRGSVERLKEAAIPSFSYPEDAVRAFKRLCDHAGWRKREQEEPIRQAVDRDAAGRIIQGLIDSGRYEAGEDVAMELLSLYGFTFPQKGLARSAKEAAAIAERLEFPVVMKISSPDILHKTDVGGIKLNINTEIAAEDAFVEITSNVRRLMPEAYIEGVMIYEMIKGGKEVILGVSYDRTFGHMIMFGLGGIYVEVLKDVSFRIAPVSRREASAMVNEIRSSALLKGARGEKPADIEEIIEGIVKLSSLVTDFPIIHGLDVNPLMVLPRGAFALDARIILERPGTSEGGKR
ncbi:MAG: acetate--CoA ligase family protein [Thermodesulfovibrionales bacterium]|jgi:acetyltransferase